MDKPGGTPLSPNHARWSGGVKLLLDTNIVSYWHSGEPRFKIPLSHYFNKIRRENKQISLYISVITVQELACWAKPQGEWESIHQFLRAKFGQPLTFCELCAHKAADMQIRSGPPGKASESEKAEWHHDAALVGTAAQHELNVIVTADKNMYSRYAAMFNEIVRITAVDE